MDQYNEAVQHPGTAFRDSALKAGKVALSNFGIPIALGGGFALTYTVTAQGRKYAVRCFHKQVQDLESRYARITQALRANASSYFVGFEYQPQGILVNGAPYPIVKMEWVEGDTLGNFLEANYSDKNKMGVLRDDFRTLEKFLRSKAFAHGDLQNGNVIVGNSIKLVDYDGMFVPGMTPGKGSEIGHRHFQHPKRSASDFGPQMDRFSFIAIDLSLRALLEQPTLFQDFSNGDNILFAANDFADPAASAVFARLRSISALTRDVDNFAQVCGAAPSATPTLEDFLAGRAIPPRTIIVGPGSPPAAAPPPYIGAYEVLDARDFAKVLQCVGDRIELIGQITDVKHGKTRYGKPYVFINFGNWKGEITKVNVWSEGLAKLSQIPDASWVGKWLSITGLVDPPYRSKRYKRTRLSITVTEANQLRLIPETEARRRLRRPVASSDGRVSGGNKAVLDTIRGRSGKGVSIPAPVSPPPAPQSARAKNEAILDQIKKEGGAPSRPTGPAPKAPKPRSAIPSWFWWALGIGLVILWVWLSRKR